ncbi:MAG: hypothetical protein ACRCW1_03385 [Anaerotignaceae bacterium]
MKKVLVKVSMLDMNQVMMLPLVRANSYKFVMEQQGYKVEIFEVK